MSARIDRIPPEQWQRVRAVRLRALADAPDGFATTLAEDEARPLDEWRTRLQRADAATFVARVGEQDVGLVTGAPYTGRPGSAGLFGMWVDPAFRGRRIASALVDAVVTWAREAGYRRVLLEVGDHNADAIRLYHAKGFLPTGATGSLPPPREHVLEHERALELTSEPPPPRR